MQRHAGRDSRSALRGCLAGILSRSRAATSLPRPFHRCWRIAGTFPAGAWLATPTLRACRSALRASGIGRAGLVRSRSGLAALEFALIAPILVAACAGLYDLTSAFLASQRINMAALAIAQIGTYQAANSNNTNMNILNLTETQTATSAIYAYLPDTLTAANSSFGVLVTSVVVTLQDPACTSSCTYIPNVAWSGQYQGGAGSTRVCGASALSWVADTAAASSTTLPTDLQQPQPVLVVDVYYTFRPVFFTFITGNILMERSAYFPPRTGLTTNWVQYYWAGSPDNTVQCAGYPWSTINP
jgi:Flp pilus assembly protein TadG